ncbi:MAG: hypothetical protein ACI4J7_09260 [Ruminiclostridium sp.]
MRDAERHIVSFGNSAKDATDKAVLGFGALKSTVAALGLGKMIKDSISGAMNAVESESLFEVSLGSFAKQAREWSEEISGSYGLDGYALRKNLGTIYNMTSSMGLAKKAAYDLSTGVTMLAEDMASFYNLSSDEAFGKLKSGLTGEAEPLKALGILVDENTVKQYAYKTGIAKAGEELTQQQKVLARYQAILGQTANAQGDIARTLDSPANKLRRIQNQLANLSTEAGMGLMPLVSFGFSAFSQTIDAISPAIIGLAQTLGALGTYLNNLSEPQKKLLAGAVAFAVAIPAVTLATKALAGAKIMLGKAIAFATTKQLGFTALLKGGLGIIAAVLAMTALLGGTQQNVDMSDTAKEEEKVGESADKGADGVKKLDKSVNDLNKTAKGLAGFDEITKLSGGTSENAIDDFASSFEDTIAMADEYDSAISDALNSTNDLLGLDFSAFTQFWDNLWKKITSGDWKGAFELVGKGIDDSLTKIFGESYTKIRDYWADIINIAEEQGVESAISKCLSDIDGLLSNAFGENWDNWSDFWQNAGKNIYEFLNGDFDKGLRALNSQFEALMGDFGVAWSNFWQGVGSGLYELMNKDQVDAIALDSKYFGTYQDMQDSIVNKLKSGMSSADALEQTKAEYLTTSEAVYWYNNVLTPDARISYSEAEQWRNNLINSGQISAGGVSGQITAEDVYESVSAALENNAFGPIDIRNVIELDGDVIGENVTSYQNRRGRISNGLDE